MDQQADVEIVKRALAGDMQSYALLVEAYKIPVFNLALRMTGGREDADDLTQETFIRAYEKLHYFNPQKKFFTWLYTIALNLIRNHLKNKARNVLPSAEAAGFSAAMARTPVSGEDVLLSIESMRRLEKTMQKLPVAWREAIILKYQQDLTFEEVSDITGESVGAVKMRIYRGLGALKKMLED